MTTVTSGLMNDQICGSMTLAVTHGSNAAATATTSTFMTYTYAYDTNISSDRKIEIDPTLNTEVGDYTVSMTLTLDEYPTVSESFTFIITVTPC